MSKLTGDWGKVQVALKNLRGMRDDYHNIAEEVGEDIAMRIREYIENQELDFAPLTDEYLQKKISQGYDARTLIRTGDYLNSIEVTETDVNGDEINVFISVEDGQTETNISMKELAQYIEYGTENQPARLPFTQSWERMRDIVRREVERKVRAEVRKAVNV